MSPFPSPLLLLLLASGITGTIYFERHPKPLVNDPMTIVKNHMAEVVKACDAFNETAFLQLVAVSAHVPNKTLSMMVFGSYDYYPTEAEFFNHGHIYTVVDMKKPEREMYMYFHLRPADPSPSGWTIYNLT